MQGVRAISPQFIVYIAGGVLSAVVDIGTLQLLLGSGSSVLAATSIGFGAGLLVNYAFHAKVTFKNVTNAATFARYLCVVAVNYLLTVGIVSLAVTFFDAPLLGKIASLPIIALNGFLLIKHWAFK